MLQSIWLKSVKYKAFTFPAVVFLVIIMITMLAKGSEVELTEHAVIKKGDFSVKIRETGEIKSINFESVRVPRSVNGNLQIIYLAEEGITAKKGEVICKLDPNTVLQEIDQYQDELDLAKANLKKAKVTQAARMKDLNSAVETSEYSHRIAKIRKELLKFESDSRQEEAAIELIQSELSLEEAKKQIEAQKIIDESELTNLRVKISESENKLSRAQRNLDALNIKAPITGLVVYEQHGWPTRVKTKVGDNVHRNQRLIKLPDLENMQAVFRLNEIDKSRIQVGLKAEIRLDAYPKALFHGTVTGITSIVDWWDQSNLKLFLASVKIEETDPRLKPGLSASIDLIIRNHSNVKYVPLSSVREAGGETVIFKAKSEPDPVVVNLVDRNFEYAVIETELPENTKILQNCFWGNPLGKQEYLTEVNHKFEKMQGHFSTMEDLGISYDYNGNRGKKREVKKPSAEEAEFQKFMEQMKKFGMDKRFSEKQLREMFQKSQERKKSGGKAPGSVKMKSLSGQGSGKSIQQLPAGKNKVEIKKSGTKKTGSKTKLETKEKQEKK